MTPLNEDIRSFERLCRLIAHLRGPEGCPWDREQTHSSLKPNLLEEAYETLEALDAADDPARLKEELGDLLLQVVFHAQIAAEAGKFTIEDVIESVADKLVRRHPHVFGTAAASTAQEVWRRWDTIKREERGEDTSALDGVPAAMPALAYAQALLGRAARTGFRWPSTDNILEKLTEEMLEFAEADTPEDRQEEFGDVLINLVNFAFMSDLDAESALRQSASKFRSRFRAMEELARAEGRELSEMPLAEMEKLWNQAKGSDRGLGRR